MLNNLSVSNPVIGDYLDRNVDPVSVSHFGFGRASVLYSDTTRNEI